MRRKLCNRPEGQCMHQSNNNVEDLSIQYGNYIAALTLAVSAAIAGIVLWSLFGPIPKISVLHVHDKLLESPVASRDDIGPWIEVLAKKDLPSTAYIYSEFCLNSPLYHGTIASSIIAQGEDNASVILDTRPVSLPEGCYNASIPVSVPPNIKSGKHIFSSNIAGPINVFRDFNVNLYTLIIEI